MNSMFTKALVAGLALAPTLSALSLYDTAPSIGIPESYNLRWRASISGGYDDNVNSSKNNREGSAFASFSVGASYADFESMTRISYDASLGGRLYNKRANGVDERLFGNCRVSAQLNHSFDSRNSMSATLSLSYTPEPDYANGISRSLRQGDCFTWSLSGSFNHAIDSRWSVGVNAGYSGNIYTNSIDQIDDREYATVGANVSYRYSALTSFTLSASTRYDMRRYGLDSENIYLNLGVSHSLSPISSMSMSVGAQCKMIDGDNRFSPTVRFGYNRRITDGLSGSAYLSMDNENINTYLGQGLNYLGNITYRAGVDFTQAISHKVNLNFGGSLIYAQYDRGTGGLANSDQLTYSLFIGMSYSITSSLSANVRYTYVGTNKEAGDYYRNTISGGLSYTF